MVDRDSEEAEVIRKYVKNTHATTHNAYDLEVIDVRILSPFLSCQVSPSPTFRGLAQKEGAVLFCFALTFFFFFLRQTGSMVLAVLKLTIRPGWL